MGMGLICASRGTYGAQEEIPIRRNEMDVLRRQVAALTEMVQQLQPRSVQDNESVDTQSHFENHFRGLQRRRDVGERYESKWEHNIKEEL